MKEGDLLELIEHFDDKRKGYRGMCLQYSENVPYWGNGDARGVKVEGMEKCGDKGWIMARRFRVVQSAPPTTEGWTL